MSSLSQAHVVTRVVTKSTGGSTFNLEPSHKQTSGHITTAPNHAMTKRKAPASSGRISDPGFIQHKTLSAYYDVIRPLSTYLSSGPNQLLQPGDNVVYRNLIQSTLCARRTRSKGKDHDPFLGSFETSGSQEEVVEWILSDLREISGKSKRNVLLTGDKVSPHSSALNHSL